MRSLISNDAPSLFPPEPMTPSPALEEPARDEPTPHKIAVEFVRWCCSFGADFRNSPDVTNLRYWLHTTKGKLTDIDEAELLREVRRIYLKRIAQSIGA